MRDFPPPLVATGSIPEVLRDRGFVVLPAEWVANAAQVPGTALRELAHEWSSMPADPYLKDGGHYRTRRHSSFVVEGGECRQVPHRPHFQSAEYNALHGGMERWFEPLSPRLSRAPAFARLVVALADLCTRGADATASSTVSAASGASGAWYVEAHQFRIDTHEGIGRPTPEGAHRDGVDFVAVVLIARHGIKGGETRVFDAGAPHGLRFTLTEPWSVLFLDDSRVIHESTPIQPETPGTEPRGYRDTLVVTFRRGGFQER